MTLGMSIRMTHWLKIRWNWRSTLTVNCGWPVNDWIRIVKEIILDRIFYPYLNFPYIFLKSMQNGDRTHGKGSLKMPRLNFWLIKNYASSKLRFLIAGLLKSNKFESNYLIFNFFLFPKKNWVKKTRFKWRKNIFTRWATKIDTHFWLSKFLIIRFEVNQYSKK